MVRRRVSAQVGFERRIRSDLHERRWVRVHVTLIGVVTFGVLWALSHTLMRAGVDSMALRHGIALVAAYPVYLGLLWMWAKWLLSRDDGFDLGDPGVPELPRSAEAAEGLSVFRSGGGGDFGGGGASGDFSLPTEGPSAMSNMGGDAVGKAASGAVEAVGSADEGVVVLVPLALVVATAALLGMALGFAVFGLFGVEVLMGVAVEIAFAAAGGAVALKARREGWLAHAVRRTLVPMTVVLGATVMAGLAAAHWMPGATTLPQALKLIFG